MNNEQLTKINEQLAKSLFTVHCSLLFDLQWFSDENDEDAPGKNIDPTEYKIKKLREEGQVAKSQELVGAIGLLLSALILLLLAPSMLRTCIEMINFFFMRAVELDPSKDAIIAGVFLRYFARLVWPILLVAFVAAVFSNIAQIGGFLFTTKPITPNFSKALPKFGQYFKRIFSSEGVFNLAKSLAKIVIIGLVAFLFINGELEKLINLQKSDPYSSLVFVAGIAIRMILVVAVLLIIISIGDFFFQRWRFRERNKMTPKELKEEIKQYQTDPNVQHRIRSRFRELMRQNLAEMVPKADVVITNPTHLAVALQFDSITMPGPMVIAKGEEEIAARIRKIAQDYEVPLVENKPLAQLLYREINVGQIVPYEYWKVVAAIMRKVMHLNDARRRKQKTSNPAAQNAAFMEAV
ncbi:MAG: EscU/YscU/HrcU family type III secretion system export apparatus switch protein [Treponema sp.]|nr:EscU/YscU/HrcU family type III secretion system export apparatus switch protein [Treponema sp.]